MWRGTNITSSQVFVAGDDAFARDLVSGVVLGAGFTPVDLGGLSNARTIEDIPVAVFPQWRVPFYIHLSIFVFLYILGFVKSQVIECVDVIIMFINFFADMLANHLVHRWRFPVGPVEPYPHAQHQQNPVSARP